MNQTKFNYEEELSKCRSMQDITGENGLVQKIIKDAMETILQNEFNNFLNQNKSNSERNYRNGYNKKNIKTEYGDVQIQMPRDRNGEFTPEILAKRTTISDGIKSISRKFFIDNPQVVDTGVISNSLKYLIKDGVL